MILQPGLSRTETALILLMTIPLLLHAVYKVWPWPLAACHALAAAECFHIIIAFAMNVKMLLICSQQMC